MIRNIPAVCWGLYWGPRMLGNYHVKRHGVLKAHGLHSKFHALLCVPFTLPHASFPGYESKALPLSEATA